MERGVIVSPGIVRKIPKGFHFERSINKEELRYLLMYWDKVVVPKNNLVNIEIPDEPELLKLGAVTLPKIQYQGA